MTSEAPRWQCPSENCGSYNFANTGQGIVCTDCGTVIEESNFDLSVSFNENADGSRSMNGQFVSAMCSTPYRFTGAGGGIGCSRESREVTIANGKKKIQQLAAALNLNHLVDAAHRLFLSAVQRNFVHGRKTSNVVAACLYIVCRQRNAPHLLIDFSDVLQTNLFILGNCFLKFRKLLNIELPAVDPVHYIDRFAAKMELEEKTHDVAKTAHKLVARMKRDWIQTGRRPSGICGAALIIAARMHGFHRTQRQVVHIMKICDETLRKRLNEFEATPAGNLTVEEFYNVELANEADPPAFTRNRTDEETVAQLADGTAEDVSDEQLVAMGNRERIMRERARAQKSMYDELERDLVDSLREMEEQSATEETLPQKEKVSKPKISTSLVVASVEKPIVIAEEDLDDILLNSEQAALKLSVWELKNKDFIEKEEQDKRDGKVKKKRKRKPKAETDGYAGATDAIQATRAHMEATKKKSKKINYEALQQLFELQES